jgi:hypothetical protein
VADLAITASSVVPGTGAVWNTGTAGATVTAGQWVYLDSSDGRLKQSDVDNTTATAAVVGIAVHDSTAGRPLTYVNSGPVTMTTTPAMSPGRHYYASDSGGGMAPQADLAPTWNVVRLGYALTATSFQVEIKRTGLVLA